MFGLFHRTQERPLQRGIEPACNQQNLLVTELTEERRWLVVFENRAAVLTFVEEDSKRCVHDLQPSDDASSLTQ